MDGAQPQQLELARPTARVLVWGFRLSAALLLLGAVLTAIQGDELHSSLESVPDLVELVADGDGSGLIGLGILVMVMTPIASTISVALSCMRIGDRRYALVTGAVLAILVISAAVAIL